MKKNTIGTTALINGRPWSFVRDFPQWELWTAEYWCPDGDRLRFIAQETERMPILARQPRSRKPSVK